MKSARLISTFVTLLLGVSPLCGQVPQWYLAAEKVGLAGIVKGVSMGDRLLLLGAAPDGPTTVFPRGRAVMVDRGGDTLSALTFDSIVSPRHHPQLGTYRVEEMFASLATGDSGYWIWSEHTLFRDTVEPYVSVRYRLSDDFQLISVDSIAQNIDHIYADGSASRSYYNYANGTLIHTRWMPGDTTPQEEAVLDSDRLFEFLRGLQEPVLESIAHDGSLTWFLIADRLLYKSVVIRYDSEHPADTGAFTALSVGLYAQDVHVASSGDLLVAGRSVSWDPDKPTSVRVIRVGRDMGVKEDITIDRETRGPIRVVGQRSNGELILTWVREHDALLSYDDISLAVVHPSGRVLANTTLYDYDDASLRFSIDNDRSLWMTWSGRYVGRIGLPQLSAVEEGRFGTAVSGSMDLR